MVGNPVKEVGNEINIVGNPIKQVVSHNYGR